MSAVPFLEPLVIECKNGPLQLRLKNTKDNVLSTTFEKILNIDTTKSLKKLLVWAFHK